MTTENQNVNGIKIFADTTEASSTTVGGTVVSGGLAVAKRVYAANMTTTGEMILSYESLKTSSALLYHARIIGYRTTVMNIPHNTFTPVEFTPRTNLATDTTNFTINGASTQFTVNTTGL